MLHLKAGVHFEEVEALPRRVCTRYNQFDRTRAIITNRLGECDALFTHRFAHLGGYEGRRRFLDHLLVAALDAAFAFVEIENVPMLVAEDLDFDMARVEDEFLDENAVVAKAVEAFALHTLEILAHFLLVIGKPHTLAAAAR